MTEASDFKNFLADHVNLNQTRLNLLSQRVASVQNYLVGSAEFSDKVTELIPQGSFAHGTIIKPVGNKEFDADVLMPLEEIPGWDAKDYIDALHACLGNSSTYAAKRIKKKRCVTIDYANDFHIDVVPYINRLGGTYVANRETNQFELAAPDEFTAWFEDKNRITNDNLVKVVRLLKYLRDHKGTYVVPSITLTAALASTVSETTKILDPNAYKNVANTLNTLATAVSRTLDGYPSKPPFIKDPGTGQNLAERWDEHNYQAFRTRFATHTQWIAEACNAATYAEAVLIWQKLFGPNFGSSVRTLAKESAALIASATSPAEKDLTRDFHIPIRINPAYRVRVTGYIRPAAGGYKDRPLPSVGDRVGKNRSIQFRVENCTVPAPYDVYWKVRNHGEEAFNAHALRGDITDDDGSRRKTERTQYIGHHWVEVYIVKNRVCVAMDRQPVIVI